MLLYATEWHLLEKGVFQLSVSVDSLGKSLEHCRLYSEKHIYVPVNVAYMKTPTSESIIF